MLIFNENSNNVSTLVHSFDAPLTVPVLPYLFCYCPGTWEAEAGGLSIQARLAWNLPGSNSFPMYILYAVKAWTQHVLTQQLRHIKLQQGPSKEHVAMSRGIFCHIWWVEQTVPLGSCRQRTGMFLNILGQQWRRKCQLVPKCHKTKAALQFYVSSEAAGDSESELTVVNQTPESFPIARLTVTV